ncbi:bifunctional 4-hydroxy-2-oxoglutarate aldolase/2-dehydro-3-deoxy-phosphogluconate aldolase [Bacillus norwichensis]|uniref:Bifunctional 4-hydroxy-2-oxoglutarate aldolase/2-dehydro-3-deoxy-phosphogluconate aldolase n=1 Tax=Bacillus norwichensis TaxID=2762217 RepID=A0ABR8VQ65_9BACI|nr:bifunctional 4-hydroxy-2-oxoglutarate aldolase/2-dehydro-3-deoxy-phosphogluconate aldolase [Bacillus norwichensis]MBD8006916.1 bifunctional 4-hydroxy-2-oxoglutarate aldolase/2-dehydro-3-deoxy-phosphogluconate aldolase [Bacillus norwichensis]
MSSLDSVIENGVIAVLRGLRTDNALNIAKALIGGGVNTLEITMETPDALSIIKNIRTQLGDSVVVGAGTVLDSETARAAIMAGSQFIFSPTVNVETIRITKRYGVASVPGAFTPTEILKAYEAGADAVKVFPAGVLGPAYLKDIKGPLPQIPLIPTGGINLENAADFIKSGAIAIGVGGSLVNMKMENSSDFLEDLTKKAEKFVREVQSAR